MRSGPEVGQRAALDQLATNVAVITAYDGDQPHGVTANAWGEGQEPPMVLVTLRRPARSLEVVMAAGVFAVNVLAADQEDLAGRFARREGRRGERWAEVQHRLLGGAPVLEGCVAQLVARVTGSMAFGAHEIVTGRVVRSVRGGEVPPLLFHDNAFGRFVPARRTRGQAVARAEYPDGSVP